jgi:polyisoprenyl-phosphate glycosyltransferase
MQESNTFDRTMPLVSIVIPGYNEEAIIVKNLTSICDYLAEFSNKYNWEIIFVNDGSHDKTGVLAERFAETS